MQSFHLNKLPLHKALTCAARSCAIAASAMLAIGSVPAQAGEGLAPAASGESALSGPVCGPTKRMEQLISDWMAPKGRVMIAAHRGGHLVAPENSLAAVDEAVAAGADILEVDVKVTADGVPYIMHDRTLDRTTNGTGDSEALSYAQLRGLRLDGSDTAPPSLAELLRHSCGRILVDLDMKTDRIGPVIAVIQALGMQDQVMLFDADGDILRRSQQIEPALKIMSRLKGETSLAQVNHGLEHVRIVHGDPEALTPAMVRAIEAWPARIWINSLGGVDATMKQGDKRACYELLSFKDKGVTVIQTDVPQVLAQHLESCFVPAG